MNMHWLLAGFLLSAMASAAPAQDLELKKGDHICIIGNTLAERMQHDGWLETRLHSRFADYELVFRNMGYSGDEIDGFKNPNHRLRSMSFGSQDEWLTGSAPCPQRSRPSGPLIVLTEKQGLPKTPSRLI